MGIVRALVEVYNLPNVKLPLKFEIEILSGLLEFSVSEIQPSELLRNRRAYGGPGPINDFEGGPPSFESAEDRAAANASKYQLQYVHLNPSLPMFNQQPALKKAVYVAINRAIHDVRHRFARLKFAFYAALDLGACCGALRCNWQRHHEGTCPQGLCHGT